MLTEYHEQLESWYNSLTNGQPSDDVYGVLIEALTSHSVLGNIDLTVPGGTAKRESTVTAAQVHQALIDAQRHSDFVFGELDYSLPTLFAVLARAGDRRFEPVSDVLPFAHRVRAFVQVVLGEIDTQSALEGAAAEIQTNQGSTGSPEEISQVRTPQLPALPTHASGTRSLPRPSSLSSCPSPSDLHPAPSHLIPPDLHPAPSRPTPISHYPAPSRTIPPLLIPHRPIPHAPHRTIPASCPPHHHPHPGLSRSIPIPLHPHPSPLHPQPAPLHPQPAPLHPHPAPPPGP